MKIIVLDFEASKPKYKGDEREIIEIGAFKLDENLKVISKFQTYVRPYLDKNKKDLIIDGKLTIPKERFIRERDLNRKMYVFEKWIAEDGDDYVIATWSSSDINIIVENYNVLKFNFKWMKNHIDIQKCFGDFKGLSKRISLVNAYKMVNNKNIKSFNHNALNDAYNSAVILKYLVQNGYKFTYEKNPFKNVTYRIKMKCSSCNITKKSNYFPPRKQICFKCFNKEKVNKISD